MIEENGLTAIENFGYWQAWFAIALVAAGTFCIRYSFLGLFAIGLFTRKKKATTLSMSKVSLQKKKTIEEKREVYEREMVEILPDSAAEVKISPVFKEWMSYVPAAAFAGIVFPALLLPGWQRYHDGDINNLLLRLKEWSWAESIVHYPYIMGVVSALLSREGAAALAAFFVFFFSRSITLTILVGIAVYWWLLSTSWFV